MLAALPDRILNGATGKPKASSSDRAYQLSSSSEDNRRSVKKSSRLNDAGKWFFSIGYIVIVLLISCSLTEC